MRTAFTLTLIQLLFISGYSQTPIGEWTFRPLYTLERNAKASLGPSWDTPTPNPPILNYASDPLEWFGQTPTERLNHFYEIDKLPKGPFSVELWLLDHVNQPIGAMLSHKGQSKEEAASWALGYYNHNIAFTIQTTSGTHILQEKVSRGFKKYFYHLVGTYDGEKACLYINGVKVKEDSLQAERFLPELGELEGAAYMKKEPYMDLGNLLQQARMYDKALEAEKVEENFQKFQEEVDGGILVADQFHFLAGPYLQYATQNSINLIWETDRPTKGVVKYGKDFTLSQTLEISSLETIQEATLADLEAGTNYYYQITAEAEEGQRIQTDILSFQTAVADDAPFTFTVFGDTEARAHINDRLAKWVWEERPNFMINLGDLTDGGKEPHKFEWNYEYFQGMNQLISRIPIFPVAGNGESDLYWYKKYHHLPNGEAYYTFKYGNAEFFMLNSNEKEQLKPGGIQYVWLEEALKNSSATWKFACHHHAVFTSDENDYGNTWNGEKSNLGDLQVRELVALYEKYEVDMVMYGHLHTYERTWPLKDGKVDPSSGVVYMVAGGAGGNLEDFAPTHSWFSTKLYRRHHYTKIDIFEGKLYFKMYDLNGALKDFMELSK